jgi:hypothetical protein
MFLYNIVMKNRHVTFPSHIFPTFNVPNRPTFCTNPRSQHKGWIMEVRSRVASQLRIEGDTPTLENIGRTNQEAL